MAIKFSASEDEKQIIIAGLLDPSHRPSTVAILRRVEKIHQLILNSTTEIKLDHDDFEFLLDRFRRAENWNIAETETETPTERIKKITAVEGLLDAASKSLS